MRRSIYPMSLIRFRLCSKCFVLFSARRRLMKERMVAAVRRRAGSTLPTIHCHTCVSSRKGVPKVIFELGCVRLRRSEVSASQSQLAYAEASISLARRFSFIIPLFQPHLCHQAAPGCRSVTETPRDAEMCSQEACRYYAHKAKGQRTKDSRSRFEQNW
jgi:hypothetical protein